MTGYILIITCAVGVMCGLNDNQPLKSERIHPTEQDCQIVADLFFQMSGLPREAFVVHCMPMLTDPVPLPEDVV